MKLQEICILSLFTEIKNDLKLSINGEIIRNSQMSLNNPFN